MTNFWTRSRLSPSRFGEHLLLNQQVLMLQRDEKMESVNGENNTLEAHLALRDASLIYCRFITQRQVYFIISHRVV